jgi:hypothetical protein
MVKLSDVYRKGIIKDAFESGDILGLKYIYDMALQEDFEEIFVSFMSLMIDINLELYTVDKTMNKFTYSGEKLYQSLLKVMWDYLGIEMGE